MVNSHQVVINTAVYLKDLENGKSQSVCLTDLAKLGVKNVEIRREFVHGDEDFMLIVDTARSLGQKLFYSVPDTLFKKGKLNRSMLQVYMEEAIVMQAEIIKFNVGHFNGWTPELIQEYKELTKDFKGTVTVENDQTEENGKLKALLQFLEATKKVHLPIKATFDIGNVFWVNEEPVESASIISDYACYVHMKDVVMTEAGPEAAFLGEGIIPWEKVLSQFKPDVYIAIEYPCGDNPNETIKREFEKVVS
jgi:sugar phosphate isomerase/epimerase